MAVIRKLEEMEVYKNAKHTEVDATFSVVVGDNGEKFLQIDTYGSIGRKLKGKKSQSMRFSSEAISQLKNILEKF